MWVRRFTHRPTGAHHGHLRTRKRELAQQYEKLFALKRASATVAQWAMLHTPIGAGPMLLAPLTPFAQVMPDRFRCPDPVQAYRAYYATEKLTLRNKPMTWTGGDRMRPSYPCCRRSP